MKKKEVIVIDEESQPQQPRKQNREVIVIDEENDEEIKEIESTPIASIFQTSCSTQQTQQQQQQSLLMSQRVPTNGIPFTLHRISTNQREGEEFFKLWLSQSFFAFSLLYSLPTHHHHHHQQTASEIGGGENEDFAVVISNGLKLDGIALCWQPGIVHWVSSHLFDFYRILRISMVNTNTTKILFNMKPQLKILLASDIVPLPPFYDPKIAIWITEMGDTNDYSLNQLVERYCGKSFAIPINLSSSFNDFDACCIRARQSLILYQSLQNCATPQDLSLLNTIEMPLLSILAKMEFDGIGFSKESCFIQRNLVEVKLRHLEEKAQNIAGVKWSLSSKEEASKVLFNILKLPIPDIPDAKAGRSKRNRKYPSTKIAVLEALVGLHPVPALLLEHRKLSHILSQNIDNLGNFAHMDYKFQMLRIHSVALQTSTPTGRLSMTNPNLQSVVNDFSFEEEEEQQQQKQQQTISIRKAFIATNGSVLLSSDFCQLEVRLMAHFSQDPLLLSILLSPENEDVFKSIASKWLNKSIDSISGMDRQRAKGMCYGVLYGMGTTSLSQQLHCSKEEAKNALASFKQKFYGVTQFLDRVVKECEQNGFVTTLLGRRRSIPGIFSKQDGERKQAERQAINTICQGSGADIVKSAMVNIDKQISSRLLQSHLVLEMHDELLYEVSMDELSEIQLIVKSSMETAVNLSIPLPVHIRFGNSWGNMTSK